MNKSILFSLAALLLAAQSAAQEANPFDAVPAETLPPVVELEPEAPAPRLLPGSLSRPGSTVAGYVNETEYEYNEKWEDYDYHPRVKKEEKKRGYLRGGLHWGGPRIGVTYIGEGRGADSLKELVKEKLDVELEPWLTQYGWHFEYRMFRTESGLTAMTQFIPLVAGLEQGLALPSANLLMGMRTKNGFELGFGPQASMKGVGLVLGAGYTIKGGGLNFPVNLAASLSNQSAAITLITGFNLQRD